jgi:anhydro-N-acetylmuramic acid kinase
VLNIGGIANLTLLPGDGAVQGFDCGPGNVLMDGWAARHLGLPFDRDGAWASQGTVHARLLELLLAEPFFAKRPPKSTGRDLFHAQWLDDRLAQTGAEGSPVQAVHVQATLAELTARAACDALSSALPDAKRLLVCGGGALNGHLMQTLQRKLPATRVLSTQAVGIDPMQVEAIAFAWLARAFITGQPGNCPEVTGAAGLRRLGAFCPA